MTKNKVKDLQLLEQLRKIEPGKWLKVYRDGFIEGRKVSIHYFESPSGKVFDAAIHYGWSNL